MLELTVITPDDWQDWRELRLRALTEAPYAFDSRLADWQTADEARWRQRLSRSVDCNLIARLDGRPAGMVSGIPGDDPGVAELISMWVEPNARGQGVSDALVAAVTAWASQQGSFELRLDVTNGNARAIALYARHGFVDRGPSSESSRSMAKVLGSRLSATD